MLGIFRKLVSFFKRHPKPIPLEISHDGGKKWKELVCVESPKIPPAYPDEYEETKCGKPVKIKLEQPKQWINPKDN